MNDCIWCFIFCECSTGVADCKKYLSVNSKEGNAILEEYETDVEPIILDAVKPVVEKFIKKFKQYGEVE